MNETTLLVGETGTGKTTAVQEIAKLIGKKLHVFNMNQNTDSADLLGGFKPVDLKYLLTPVYKRFLEQFTTLMASDSDNNQKFLDLTQKCYENNKVKDFVQCLNHGMKSLKAKLTAASETTKSEIASLEQLIKDLQKRCQKVESGGGFVFQFVEGTLIESI